MNHTPAPWEWDGDVCDYNKEQDAPWLIGGPDAGKILGGEITCGNPADRDLIAAAPELLEALKLLHDNTADYVRINNLGDPYQNQDMRMARDAIAKAEGKL